MSKSTQQIFLDKPPSTTEIILLKIGKFLLWFGFYVLSTIAFLYTGTAKTIIATLKQSPVISADLGKITINTRYIPAYIEIDAEEYGKTPQSELEILAGNHLLTLTPAYFSEFLIPLNLPVVVSPNLHTVIQAENGTNFYSSSFFVVYSIPSKGEGLIVYTIPANAQVYLNKEYKGNSPYIGLKIAPGSYTLKITAVGYEPQSLPISITENYTTVVVVKMYRKLVP